MRFTVCVSRFLFSIVYKTAENSVTSSRSYHTSRQQCLVFKGASFFLGTAEVF